MKKVLALLMATMMLFSLAACQGSDDNTTNTGSESGSTATDGGSESNEEVVYDGTWGSPIVAEPTVIKIFARQDKDFVVDPEATFFKAYTEMTGVVIEGTANPNVETITDLNVHATDGFPSDIISVGNVGNELERYAAEGAFADINDYLEYMPNLQAFLETDLGKQAYEASLNEAGELLLIPAVERFKPTHIPMIRQDWLDELGLEVPQTTEELYTALKAFKDNELGDGLTIPFLAKSWVLKQNSPTLFGARIETRATGRMVNDLDGTFTHGWTSDEFRNYVVNLSKWYDEGILAQDVFTADNPLDEHFPTDQGGFTYYSASKLSYNDQPSMPEGFELVPMLPTEYDGTRMDQRATHYMRKGRIGISIASENKVLAAKVIDSLLCAEAALTQRYGFEGVQYELEEEVDGVKVYRYTQAWTDTVMNDFNGDYTLAAHEEGFINIGLSEDAFYDQQRVIAQGVEYGNSVIDQVDAMYLEAFADGTVEFIPAITMSFSPDETVEISNIKGALETYQDEFFELAITSDYTSLDDAWWNDYMSICKDLGVERIVEIYNAQ